MLAVTPSVNPVLANELPFMSPIKARKVPGAALVPVNAKSSSIFEVVKPLSDSEAVPELAVIPPLLSSASVIFIMFPFVIVLPVLFVHKTSPSPVGLTKAVPFHSSSVKRIEVLLGQSSNKIKEKPSSLS